MLPNLRNARVNWQALIWPDVSTAGLSQTDEMPETQSHCGQSGYRSRPEWQQTFTQNAWPDCQASIWPSTWRMAVRGSALIDSKFR